MPVTDPNAYEDLRAELVRALRSGPLRDPEWTAAFTATPRHLFVDACHAYTADGGVTLDPDDPAQRDDWARLVYSDTSLVTKFSDDGFAVASSTAPSLMALMLEALDVAPGNRVLEIGTGTGYNAALLCHRLGADNVYSVDVDPELVTAARRVLHALGYAPCLAAGDGRDGHPEPVTFDRVITTCGVPVMPAAWVRATVPGGVVVASVGPGICKLIVDAEGTATGRFVDTAGFIPARTLDRAAHADPQHVIDTATAITADAPSRTMRSPDDLDHPGLRFFVDLLLPGVVKIDMRFADRTRRCLLDNGTRSAAVVDLAARTAAVVQAGPRRIWNELMAIRDTWYRIGEPEHHRMGLTVTATGRHTAWLDHPDNVERWPVRA